MILGGLRRADRLLTEQTPHGANGSKKHGNWL